MTTEGVFLNGVYTGSEVLPPNKLGNVYRRAAFAFGAQTRVINVTESIYNQLQTVPRFTEVHAELGFREYEGQLSLEVRRIEVGKGLSTVGLPAGKAA